MVAEVALPAPPFSCRAVVGHAGTDCGAGNPT